MAPYQKPLLTIRQTPPPTPTPHAPPSTDASGFWIVLSTREMGNTTLGHWGAVPQGRGLPSPAGVAKLGTNKCLFCSQTKQRPSRRGHTPSETDHTPASRLISLAQCPLLLGLPDRVSQSPILTRDSLATRTQNSSSRQVIPFLFIPAPFGWTDITDSDQGTRFTSQETPQRPLQPNILRVFHPR